MPFVSSSLSFLLHNHNKCNVKANANILLQTMILLKVIIDVLFLKMWSRVVVLEVHLSPVGGYCKDLDKMWFN